MPLSSRQNDTSEDLHFPQMSVFSFLDQPLHVFVDKEIRTDSATSPFIHQGAIKDHTHTQKDTVE